MRPLKFSPRTRAFLRVLLSHYITNGITACLGLLVISLIVENWLGAYAASLATVGVIAVTPPDVAAPRRGKLRTMMLPFIAGVPVFYIVQLLNGRHLELGIFLTFFSFLAFLAMAWGKRGIPVAMGMMFTAIFSIASHRPGAESAALQSTLYFSIGAGLYVIWATLANLALNARYRALAMADVLISLADLIRTEARQFRHQRACDTDECEALLSQLLKAQAALADQMQATRDIVLESPRTPFRQRIAGMLVIVIDIRDQLLASELDLDGLRTHPRHRHALAQMRSVLDELADEVDALADALFLGYRPRPAIDRRTRIATIRSTHASVTSTTRSCACHAPPAASRCPTWPSCAPTGRCSSAPLPGRGHPSSRSGAGRPRRCATPSAPRWPWARAMPSPSTCPGAACTTTGSCSPSPSCCEAACRRRWSAATSA